MNDKICKFVSIEKTFKINFCEVLKFNIKNLV